MDAKKIINEVTGAVSQRSASKKDEVTVMRAIINDPEYSVDVYDKTGKCGNYQPGADFRKMVSNVVSNTTKIPYKEAKALVDNYEFTKSDATTMVGVSKEFINTYLQTGRKLPLGGREKSDVELMWKTINQRTTEVPVKTASGQNNLTIPEHQGIRALNHCPSWIREKK